METSVTMNTLFLYILLVCGVADVLVQGKADSLLLLTRLIIIILSVCLSACLSVCLFVCLSVSLPVCCLCPVRASDFF